MTPLRWLALVAPAALVVPAAAQQAQPVARLEVRVMAATPGRAIVDRGSADGVAPGDRVELRPRGGAPLAGIVSEVRERVATVELDDRKALLDPGTRGEVTIPESRRPKRAPPEPPPAPVQPAQPAPEAPRETPVAPAPEGEPAAAGPPAAPPSGAPRWTNRDEGFDASQPLLARVPPLEPAQRDASFGGRAWTALDLSHSTDGSWNESSSRAGADLHGENLLGFGERLRADLELAHRSEFDDDHGPDLMARRLSCAWGGTRFEPHRFEVGRFLQHAVPELGVLDGAEWGARLDGGTTLGASVGAMPEPDDDFGSFADWQAAVSCEWVADESERLALTGALQQTWHEGAADRRLAFGKARWLPAGGYDVHVAAWLDVYDGGDDAKGSGVEITQGIAQLVRRHPDGSGWNVSFQHVAFPELEREGEFLPLDATTLARAHLERLTLGGRSAPGGDFAVHGELGGYVDEEESGGFAEAGFDVPLPLLEDARLDVTGFATAARFTEIAGLRVGVLGGTNPYWDCWYELANHRQEGFSAALDDVVQQRFFASHSFWSASGLRISARLELRIYDDEHAWLGGLSLERSF